MHLGPEGGSDHSGEYQFFLDECRSIIGTLGKAHHPPMCGLFVRGTTVWWHEHYFQTWSNTNLYDFPVTDVLRSTSFASAQRASWCPKGLGNLRNLNFSTHAHEGKISGCFCCKMGWSQTPPFIALLCMIYIRLAFLYQVCTVEGIAYRTL